MHIVASAAICMNVSEGATMSNHNYSQRMLNRCR